MKSRSKELLDRAIAATVAAIEIYNKPDFPYRSETFCILAINGWELLLKAKWLKENGNNIRSLYVMETRTNKDGTKSKRHTVKLTRSKNPYTLGLDYLSKKLVEQKFLDQKVVANIEALHELRDSSVHFYYQTGTDLALVIQEVDLPPMFVPPVMLVRQVQGQGRQARGPQAPAAGSPESCAV